MARYPFPSALPLLTAVVNRLSPDCAKYPKSQFFQVPHMIDAESFLTVAIAGAGTQTILEGGKAMVHTYKISHKVHSQTISNTFADHLWGNPGDIPEKADSPCNSTTGRNPRLACNEAKMPGSGHLRQLQSQCNGLNPKLEQVRMQVSVSDYSSTCMQTFCHSRKYLHDTGDDPASNWHEHPR